MIDSFKGEYAFLSNYYDCNITDSTYWYDSVEAYFQAQKTTDMNVRRLIAAAPTPGESKRLGRAIKLRSDWEMIKDDVMYAGLYRKFSEPSLKQALLDTGDEKLVEGNYWHDNYWGDCKCEKCRSTPGRNMLGELLMDLREELKES